MGRRQAELDAAVRAIGDKSFGIQGDVSKLSDLDRLYETVKAHKRPIDIVFANAGILERAPLGSITEEHFARLIDTNVKGALFTVQKALPLLNDGGSIILTASVAGSKGAVGPGGLRGDESGLALIRANLDLRAQGSTHSLERR